VNEFKLLLYIKRQTRSEKWNSNNIYQFIFGAAPFLHQKQKCPCA